jgi:hypothetical protein
MNKREALFLLLLLIPVTIYFLRLEPSLVGGDGDEYLLQAYQGGIAHPCGYPIYLWIGRIVLALTNNSLNSMNIVSFVFSALTLFFLCFFLRRLGVSVLAAIVAVLIFSFSPLFWKFATEAEVYNVNAFFLTVTLYLFFLWREKQKMWNLLVGCLFYGLSLGVYFANILILPPIVIFIVYECQRESRSFIKKLLIALTTIALGAIGPLLYIYFRSRTLPPLGTYYNPDNVTNLILYLSGAQFGTLNFGGWIFLIKRIIFHINLLVISFSGVGLFFAFKGLMSEWQKRRSYLIFLVLSAMANFGYFSHYRAWDSYTMLGLTFLVITIFIGIGLHKLFSEKINSKDICLICVMLLLNEIALQVFPPSSYYNIFCERNRKDQAVLIECLDVLSFVPNNSIIISDWYRFTSFLCLQSILKIRQDVTLYEIYDQPRNYTVNNEIKPIWWDEYINNHILNSDRPIFLYPRVIDAYIENKYIVKYEGKEVVKGLFLLNGPKNRYSAVKHSLADE